ncbi:SDR family NAD(P)-dependent oxidoreductase [Phenylobacterium sp. J426]|nr:SDR family NAD(P)-dependent oxidoreductase [Phenylobacterium sp. J426]
MVVITGASSGNGRATALAFAREGASLVLAARGAAALADVTAVCEALGSEVVVQVLDVRNSGAVELLGTVAIERFGRIDVWVNNAGVLQYGRFDETPAEVAENVIRTNLFGYMNGARVALRHFRDRGRGTLINVSSILGEIGHPYTAAYVASKFAIRGLTESLRAEVRDQPHVHVCTVLPAAIDTAIYQHAANYTGHAVSPIWALYPPEVVARAVLDLARRPRREIFAGSYGRVAVAGRRIAPALTEHAVRLAADLMEVGDHLAPITTGNLETPIDDGHRADGGWRRHYRRRGRAAAITGPRRHCGARRSGIRLAVGSPCEQTLTYHLESWSRTLLRVISAVPINTTGGKAHSRRTLDRAPLTSRSGLRGSPPAGAYMYQRRSISTGLS